MGRLTIADRSRWHGHCTIEVRSAQTGRLLRRIGQRNTMPTPGHEEAWRLIFGHSTQRFSHVALGTGSTATAQNQQALESEQFRTPITSVSISGKQAIVRAYLGPTEGNGFTYSEAGLHNGPLSQAQQRMLARATFAPVAKTNLKTVTVVWTFTST